MKLRSAYPHHLLTAYFDAWLQQHPEHLIVARAIDKMYGMAALIAATEYDLSSNDDADITNRLMALAWEDIAMAFRGRGDHLLTGAVLHVYMGMTSNEKVIFAKGLEQVLQFIEAHCLEQGVQLRYREDQRACVVLYQPQQFTLPVAIPATSNTTDDFVEQGGVTPTTVKSVVPSPGARASLPSETKTTPVKGKPQFRLLPGGLS